jgi:succinate dehydrogenase/fumarate reductase flavoprotein subunit
LDRFDAIIVGAGAAGLSAATCAAAHNAHVLLLDCSDGTDSDFARSGGGPSAAGTVWQTDAGIDDGPELWSADIRRKTNNVVEESIVRLVTTRARDALHFQARQLGLDIHLVQNIPVAGHSVRRLYGTPKEDGREYFEMLTAAAGRMPGIVRRNDVEVSKLNMQGAAVRGVCAQINGKTQDIDAPITVLACGGFAANRDMLLRFAPEIAKALHIGCPYNNGAGIRWAQQLGAATSYLDSYQGHGHVTIDHKGRLGLGLTTLGAILVDQNGHRFVREDIGPSELAAHVLAAPGGSAIELYDQRVHEAALSMGAYRDSIARGMVFSAPSLLDLASQFALPPEALLATLDSVNRAARGEAADPLSRERYAQVLSPPFWGVRITGALAHTQGGLMVDDKAQVLRIDGSVIAGLLAAGGTVTGISGHGAAGYSSGNGLAQAFALGMIAAETITAEMGKRR